MSGWRWWICFRVYGHVETVVLLSKGEIDSKRFGLSLWKIWICPEFQEDGNYPQIKEYVLSIPG